MQTKSVKVLFIFFIFILVVSTVGQANSNKATAGKKVNSLKKNDTEAKVSENENVDKNSANIDKEDWAAEFSEMIVYSDIEQMDKQQLEVLIKDDEKRIAKMKKLLSLYDKPSYENGD